MVKAEHRAEPAGTVYTRHWVADFMLDLVGYDPSSNLTRGTIVEPGCGNGAFLTRIVARLISSAGRHGVPFEMLADSVRAYDIDEDALGIARERVRELLLAGGAEVSTADRLITAWIVQSDYLISEGDRPAATWIVGNPPYIRVEDSDASRYAKYRDRWTTMRGRSDIYIGFFEAALDQLADSGSLCFICADRWMHNQYGAGLRTKVLDQGSIDLLLELHEVDVFETRVAAYPAITLMRRRAHTATAMATASPSFGSQDANEFLAWFEAKGDAVIRTSSVSADWLPSPFSATDSWPSGPPERLALLADLESRYSRLDQLDVTFGVGIATGLDRVFVVKEDAGVDVETDRLKKAIGPSDVVDGRIRWQSRSIISPWVDGQLVKMSDYPRLRAYFDGHSDDLKKRYVARQDEETWWRTIDKPRPDEYAEPKLIVADINDRIEPVLDPDGYWPLHSAYFIKSATWDLEVLGGYLMSDVAAAFVEAYSVRMANGHLRVSAQYLKKIRAPRYADIDAELKRQLTSAFRTRDRREATAATRRLLRLDES